METEMNESVMDEGGETTPVSPSALPISHEVPEPRTLLEKAARESNFQLKLTNYEGPLDVLLRLIEEHQLEITEVSLAQVADQFVAYMTQMPQRDARTISNFISVAAKLILIKSRALLPATPTTPEEQEEVDDLISQLKAYQIYKVAARALKARQEAGLRSFPSEPPTIARPMGKTLPLDNVTLEALSRAMQKVIAKWMPMPDAHTLVRRMTFTVHECMDRITDAVLARPRVNFADVLEGVDTRVEVVVTLLALLELLKRYEVRVYQPTLFEDIVIEYFPPAERPILDVQPELEFAE